MDFLEDLQWTHLMIKKLSNKEPKVLGAKINIYIYLKVDEWQRKSPFEM